MSQIEERDTLDEVLRLVRMTKEQLAESEGFDPKRILQTARQHQQASSRKVLSPPREKG